MTDTESTILTAKTVPEYIQKNSNKLQRHGVFDTKEDVVSAPEEEEEDPSFVPLASIASNLEHIVNATPIQGGNVNYAFRVTFQNPSSLSSFSVFLKQAPEFVAIFGPDGFPLTSKRMQQEMDVYAEWNALLGPELSRQYLPQIYFFDRTHMVVVMEFLDGYELLDQVLVSEQCHTVFQPIVATHLGDFLGKTHAATHSSRVDAVRRKYLTEHYENRAMRDIQLEFVFTKCYKEATEEQRAGLNVSDEFLKEVELMKQQYNGNTDSLVLCHGDIHPGSVMVDAANGKTKVIDPEFTVYGPPGLDVGSLLSGFVLGAIHQAFSNNTEAVNAILKATQDIWHAYVKAMKEGGISDDIIKSAEVEAVGFTVQEVCRTALEFAGGRKWLQFDDAGTKMVARKAALQIVNKCMIARHQGGMKLLLDEMKELCVAK